MLARNGGVIKYVEQLHRGKDHRFGYYTQISWGYPQLLWISV